MSKVTPRASALPFVLSLTLFLAPSASAQALQDGQKLPPSIMGSVPWSAPALPASAAPVAPVHCVGEWEESEGVMLSWQNPDLIDKLQQNIPVYITINSPGAEAHWKHWLTSHSIPLTNIHFLPIVTNSIYTRDYGPWFVWDGNNDLGIVNYTPHYGPDDDVFPLAFSSIYGINYYESGLNHVGGNFLPMGYDVAFSSNHVYEQNHPKTRAEVDAAMKTYFGLDPYRTVSPASIWHHDTWGKPTDLDTIIVTQWPKGDPEHRDLRSEATVAYYETLESPWGRPYEIIRLPVFPHPTYSHLKKAYQNTLVSNGQVYVPTYGVFPDDQIALDVFQQGFPGYDIIGVDAMGCTHYDAVHCRTRNFHRRDPIRIYPMPPGDTEDTTSGAAVTSEVILPKGAALLAGYPVLRWSETGAAPFQDLVMTPTGVPDEYRATLPARPQGTTVSFYVEARDDGVRSATYPPVAPKGLMSFEVRADTEAPELGRHLPTRNASLAAWPFEVRALAVDDMTTPEVMLEWAINGQAQAPVTLTREELCYWYNGTPGAVAQPGDLVTYRLVASDKAASANLAYHPKVGQVYSPVTATTDLAVVSMSPGPCTALYLAQTLGELDVPYTWYETWPTDWSAHDTWFICLGAYPYDYALSSTQATEVVAALAGGDSIFLEGGDAWYSDPEALTLAPHFGLQGVEALTPLWMWLADYLTVGLPGTILHGLAVDYEYEHTSIDDIDSLGGELLLVSDDRTEGFAVAYDSGTYRTLASSLPLGGLVDDTWPNCRKAMLLRYLDYFGVDHGQLTLCGAGELGTTVPVQLEASSGDAYLLLASLGDFHAPLAGLGTLRLDPATLLVVDQGVVPASGVSESLVPLPAGAANAGYEIHFQALVGPQLAPGQAALSNRDILTLVE